MTLKNTRVSNLRLHFHFRMNYPFNVPQHEVERGICGTGHTAGLDYLLQSNAHYRLVLVQCCRKKASALSVGG